ncbi:hypothetical protein GCM10017687_41450 [Streptomyces echinatus]
MTVASPAAGDALGARHDPVQGLRGLQAHPVRRTARHDHQEAVGGRLLLPVAEPVALRHAGDVQDGAAVLGGVVVPQPQPRADAGAEPGLRELLLEPGQLVRLEVADEHRVQRQPCRAQPVHPADDLLDGVRAVGAVQRQVDGEALQADVLYGLVQLRQLVLADAVPLHRGHHLDDDTGTHEAVDAVDRRHRAHHPVGQRYGLLAAPVRGQYQQVTAEPVLDARGLVRGADGEQVGTEPRGLLREPFVPEAVAVALADRDESRELLLHVLVVRPPARGVDVERERHGRTRNLSRGWGGSEV